MRRGWAALSVNGKKENLFEISGQEMGADEKILVLHETPDIRIEKIISTGQTSEQDFWYDQDEAEWVSVLQGEAVLRLEDRQVTLGQGDTILIPPHCRHQVAYTSQEPPCIWLCVFYQEGKE